MNQSQLQKRSEKAIAALECCELCPHKCGVNRLKDELGVCRIGRFAKVASHNLHFGEEPPISGTRGSGTIFFSRCNMSCIFCQNFPISHLGHGNTTKPDELAEMMLGLQKKGVHNINLVTASHVAAQFVEGFAIAKSKGLKIPIVYNSSGYDGMESLKLLEGIVDIYMPDIKYFDDKIAQRYSSAKNYWETATKAVKEMYRQVGLLKMDEDGIGISGLLIRHLILPDNLAGSEMVFEFIAKELSPKVPVNLMTQYFPAGEALKDEKINRKVTKEEFNRAKKLLLKYRLENGWVQEI